MNRIAILVALSGLVLMAGCSASGKAARKGPPPDSTGVFVDACRTLVDSITVGTDTLVVHEHGYPAGYALLERAGDTVFYAGGTMAFIRISISDGPKYFFGYNHRGSRKDWDGAMLVEVLPAAKVATGRSFRMLPFGNMLFCLEGDREPGGERKADSAAALTGPAPRSAAAIAMPLSKEPLPTRHLGHFLDACEQGPIGSFRYVFAVEKDRMTLQLSPDRTEIFPALGWSGDTVFFERSFLFLTETDSATGAVRHFVGNGKREKPAEMDFSEYHPVDTWAKTGKYALKRVAGDRKRRCEMASLGR